jgi:XTP/dITP diphosphohydrolase
MRRFTGDTLVIATHNAGKLREFQELLTPYVKEIMSAVQLNLPEPEETGKTFAENALLKARAAAQASGCVALADDSGLCVAALGGAPGLYSSRWAGPDKNYGLAMRRVHEELGAASDRSAYFICVLALAWPDGHTETVEGRCDGAIVWPPRGDKGLGYDPVFVPEDHERTFAEMDAEEKHALSHRGKAMQALAATYFSRG